MKSRDVTVCNRLGLHARAATKLVNCAARFDAEVYVVRGARRVNGKSIMGVLTLAAAKGQELTIEAEGSDESEALDAVIRLIEDRFEEED